MDGELDEGVGVGVGVLGRLEGVRWVYNFRAMIVGLTS